MQLGYCLPNKYIRYPLWIPTPAQFHIQSASDQTSRPIQSHGQQSYNSSHKPRARPHSWGIGQRRGLSASTAWPTHCLGRCHLPMQHSSVLELRSMQQYPWVHACVHVRTQHAGPWPPPPMIRPPRPTSTIPCSVQINSLDAPCNGHGINGAAAAWDESVWAVMMTVAPGRPPHNLQQLVKRVQT